MTDKMHDAKRQDPPAALTDAALDAASGGVLIGLLLPAVQKVPASSLGDGSVRTISSGVSGTG